MFAFIFLITRSHEKTYEFSSIDVMPNPLKSFGYKNLVFPEANSSHYMANHHYHLKPYICSISRNKSRKQPVSGISDEFYRNDNIGRITMDGYKPCVFYCSACRNVLRCGGMMGQKYENNQIREDIYKLNENKYFIPNENPLTDISKNQRRPIYSTNMFTKDYNVERINKNKSAKPNYDIGENQKAAQNKQFKYDELENNKVIEKTSMRVLENITKIWKILTSKPEWILCGFAFIGVIQLCIMIYLVFRNKK